jgi:hypothetical protein
LIVNRLLEDAVQASVSTPSTAATMGFAVCLDLGQIVPQAGSLVPGAGYNQTLI